MKVTEEKFNIIELEVQQCPSVRTEFLAAGTYFGTNNSQLRKQQIPPSSRGSSKKEKKEKEQVAEDDDGEFSGIEALYKVHQPLEIIQFVLMCLCLVV